MYKPTIDIELPTFPKDNAIKTTLEFLDKLIIDVILYLAYGIALLSSFKFLIFT
jgi:hypothetical protein